MTLSPRSVSRLLSAAAVVAAVLGAAVLLFPTPLADVFVAGIVLLNPLFAVVGVAGAWTNRRALVWVAALLSTGLSLLGMMSIGLFLAPTALLLLGSAVAAQAAGPPMERRETVVADPPNRRDRLQKLLAGVVSVAIGAGLVDASALDRELFGSCAQETLGCVLQTTNWDAVGLTLLGLGAVALGCWLGWRQVHVTWMLTGSRAD